MKVTWPRHHGSIARNTSFVIHVWLVFPTQALELSMITDASLAGAQYKIAFKYFSDTVVSCTSALQEVITKHLFDTICSRYLHQRVCGFPVVTRRALYACYFIVAKVLTRQGPVCHLLMNVTGSSAAIKRNWASIVLLYLTLYLSWIRSATIILNLFISG